MRSTSTRTAAPRRSRPLQQPVEDPSSALFVGRGNITRSAFFRDRFARDPTPPRRAGSNQPDAGYRVVFSESDSFLGMVVDCYGDWLAVQFMASAWPAAAR